MLSCATVSIDPSGRWAGGWRSKRGSIFDPVFGPTGNAELTRVIASPDYRVNTDRSAAGRAIHTDAEVLPQISTSGFCGTCHDVNLVNGFRLVEPETDEERWLVDFDFTIQYQPSGHKDVFLRRLTEIAYRTAPGGGTGGDLLASLTDSQSPGRCAKCHSIAPASPGDEQSLWREGVLSRAPAPLTTIRSCPAPRARMRSLSSGRSGGREVPGRAPADVCDVSHEWDGDPELPELSFLPRRSVPDERGPSGDPCLGP